MQSSPENNQQRDDQALKLLSHLFHEVFVPENEVPTSRVGQILPAYFYGWLDSRINLLNGEEICALVGVSIDTWAFVKELVASGLAVERTQVLWNAIVLGKRPNPTYPLEKVSVVLMLTWEDGTVLPIQSFVTKEMLSEGGFTDGIVAALIQKHVTGFADSVVQDGLDGLHDQGKNYRGTTPEDPFEVCMGFLVSPLKFGKIRPELIPGCELYARLFQSLVRPVLSPQHRAAVEAHKRALKGQTKSVGGWDA